jgi:lipopolysaccharide export system permease protein
MAGASAKRREKGALGRIFGLPQLSGYVLGQLLLPVAMLTLLIACVILLAESLPVLNLVINRGQSPGVFLYLTLLKLPTLLLFILPIAFFAGTMMALQRLNGDSELVVMASAGYSQRQLAVPVLLAAALMMTLTWMCGLWLMPAGERTFSAKEMDISADIGAALFNEGQFNYPSKNLTVFIRSLGADGQISGILVHNSRDPKHPITYFAQSGFLAKTPAGARLIMFNATAEFGSGPQLSVLTFQREGIDLDQFADVSRATMRKPNERYLGELLNPPDKNLTPQIRRAFFAQAQDRLSQPLYCITFAMIALAAILRGRKQRGAVALRLTMASAAAVLVRVAGYGVAGPAASHPMLAVLFYVIPLLGAGLALAVLMGYSPAAIIARRHIGHVLA